MYFFVLFPSRAVDFLFSLYWAHWFSWYRFLFAGASSESVDLLPTPGAPGSEWTKTLATDEGHESDQMFEFDGVSSAVAIPNDVLDHSLSSTFTIATWMKHKLQMNQDKLTKEHILCSADDHSMRYIYIFLMCNLFIAGSSIVYLNFSLLQKWIDIITLGSCVIADWFCCWDAISLKEIWTSSDLLNGVGRSLR